MLHTAGGKTAHPQRINDRGWANITDDVTQHRLHIQMYICICISVSINLLYKEW